MSTDHCTWSRPLEVRQPIFPSDRMESGKLCRVRGGDLNEAIPPTRTDGSHTTTGFRTDAVTVASSGRRTDTWQMINIIFITKHLHSIDSASIGRFVYKQCTSVI